jgi:hypothetical protein
MNDRQQKLMQVIDKIIRRDGIGTIHTAAENSEAWNDKSARSE